MGYSYMGSDGTRCCSAGCQPAGVSSRCLTRSYWRGEERRCGEQAVLLPTLETLQENNENKQGVKISFAKNSCDAKFCLQSYANVFPLRN